MILDRIEKGLNKASLGTYSDLKNLSSDHRDAKAAGTAGESWSDGLEFSARKLNSPGQHHDGRRLACGGCFCVFFPQTSCNLQLKHESSSFAHPLQRPERGLSCLVRLVIMIIHRGSAVVIVEATCQVSQCCQVPTF